MGDALRRALLSKVPEAQDAYFPPEVAEEELDQPIDAAISATMRFVRGRERAQGCLAELESVHGVARTVLTVCNKNSLRTPGAVLALLALAKRDRLSDPEASLRWADAAVTVAEQALKGPFRLFLARAWAEKGNAERLLEDFGAARVSLRQAFELLADEPPRSGFRGDVLSLQGSLETWMHRWPEALDCIERALESFRGARLSTEHLNRQRAQLLVLTGDLSVAVDDLIETLEMGLEHPSDPEELLPTCHNALYAFLEIALTSQDSEEREEALCFLHMAFPCLDHLYSQVDAPGWRTRQLWLMGRLHLAEEHWPEAREALTVAMERFLELELPASAAVVSLDLAWVLVRQRAGTELRKLATAACGIFDSSELRPGLWGALRLLRDCDLADAEAIILDGLKAAGAASFRRTPGDRQS